MANLLFASVPLHNSQSAQFRIDEESQAGRTQADKAGFRQTEKVTARTAPGNRAGNGGAMTPAEQTRLINEGLNALTEQLRRVNEALELLVASLAERQAEREGNKNEQDL